MPVYPYNTKRGVYWYVKCNNRTKRGFKSEVEAKTFESLLISGLISLDEVKEDKVTKLENNLDRLTGDSKPEENKSYPMFSEVTKDYLYTKESSDITYGSLDKKAKVFKNYILPLITDKDISMFTVSDCRNFKITLKENNSHLSSNYLNYILREFKAIFKHAEQYFGLPSNPSRLIECYKKSFKEKQQKKQMEECVWTPNEFARFLYYVPKQVYREFFNVLFNTGLRLGEAQALTWNDFDGNSLYVNKSLSKKSKKGPYEIKEPKSLSSIRKVSLGKTLSIRLLEYKAMQELQQGFSNDWFIFGGCKTLPQTSITRIKNKAVKESGVKKIRLHDFRHSHASNLIAGGCNIVAVSKRLGHESVEITLKVYAHLMEESDDEITNYIDNYLSKSSQILLTK